MKNKKDLYFNELKDKTIIDDDGVILDTQEVINCIWDTLKPFSIVEAKEELKCEKKLKAGQIAYLKAKENQTAAEQEIQFILGGDFIQQQYINTVEICLSDSEAFNSAFAFRLTYLTSYMNYNNILVFNNRKKSNSKYINEKDLTEVMGLSRKQLTEFKKLCFDAGILEKINIDGIEALRVNKMIACKGKAPLYYKRYSIRVSVPHIQDIYKRATAREHKQLGYLTALLPSVHLEYFVLSKNPHTEYKNYIQPLTLQDICIKLNYQTKNASRLLKDLRKTTLNGEYVFMCAYIGNKEAFFLNPRVYYKGSTPEGLKWLEELFLLAKDWEQNKKQRGKNKERIIILKEQVLEAKEQQRAEGVKVPVVKKLNNE